MSEQNDDLAAKTAATLEYDKRAMIIERMHTLRKTLCRVNCKPLLHRPPCKLMKKDIERLKEIILFGQA